MHKYAKNGIQINWLLLNKNNHLLTLKLPLDFAHLCWWPAYLLYSY